MGVSSQKDGVGEEEEGEKKKEEEGEERMGRREKRRRRRGVRKGAGTAILSGTLKDPGPFPPHLILWKHPCPVHDATVTPWPHPCSQEGSACVSVRGCRKKGGSVYG